MIMIIDGHAHACGKYLNSQSIVKYLDEHRIDMVVLCGGEPNSVKDYSYPMLSNVFTGQGLGYFFNMIISMVIKINHAADHLDEQNKAVYELTKQLPNRVINAYWVNPTEKNCIDKLEQFYSVYNFRIIKLHQCWTQFDINSNQNKKIFSWANEHKIPVFIHLRSHDQVMEFVKNANQFSDTVFIVAHMIGLDYISQNLNGTNVYFDLSAPQLYSRNMLKKALNKFGAERLILGSDTPYGIDNISKVMSRLKQLSLSVEDIDLICGSNLAKLLLK